MVEPAKVLVFRENAVSNVALQRLGAVGGRVSVAGRKTVPEGITVRLWSANWKLLGAVQVDSEGTFRFEGVEAGRYVCSLDVPAGYTVHGDGAAVELGVAGRHQLEFVLKPSGRVTGRVVDEKYGTPLAGVNVALIDEQTGTQVAKGKTTPTGDYAFSNIVGDSLKVVLAK